MAEEYLKKLGNGRFEVESAGFQAGEINPLVIETMQEENIDLSGKQTQDIMDLYKAGKRYDYVITVCDKVHEKNCPIFPGIFLKKSLNWPFEDPAKPVGPNEEKLVKIREIREQIKDRIKEFIKTMD